MGYGSFYTTKSCDLYSKLFTTICPISRPVVEWDPVTKEYFTHGIASKRYWIWYFNQFVIAGLIGFTSSLMTIYESVEGRVDLAMGAYSVFVVLVDITMCTVALIFTTNLALIPGLTRGGIIIRNLEHISKWHGRTPSLEKYTNESKKWKFYSICLKQVDFAFIGMSFVVPFATMYSQLDPFVVSIPKITSYFAPSWKLPPGIFLFFRCWFSIVCIFETSHLICFTLTFLMMTLEMQWKCLKLLSTWKDDGNKQRSLFFFKWYNIYRLNENALVKEVFDLSAVIACGGFIIFVVCNVITIRFYKALSVYIYWWFPTCSLICVFALYSMVPLAVNGGELNKELIQRRLFAAKMVYANSPSLDTKLIVKLYQGMRPQLNSVGDFCKFDKFFRVQYSSGILERTFDLILLMKHTDGM